MIELINYSEEYDEAINSFNPFYLLEIKYHGDVLKDSICLAMDNATLAGVAFLMAGPSFLCLESHDLPAYHVHMEYAAVSGSKHEIEVTELLLEDLQESFAELQENNPGKRLILRTWTKASSPIALNFLLSFGFRPMRVTPIMQAELSELDDALPDSTKPYEHKLNDASSSITIKPIDFDETLWSSYLKANEDAFKVPDSRNELAFKLNDPNTIVLGAYDQEKIVASLSIWRLDEQVAATENIFCMEKYQNQGIASALILYAFDYLKKHNYTVASLTVFGDNLKAIWLYQKHGYEVQDELLELHYELEYKNNPF